MEQEISVAAEYVNGFNDGYIVAEYMPSISKELLQNLKSDSPRSQGLQAGMNQYILEQSQQKTPVWLRQDRLSFKDHGKESRNLDREK